MDLKIKIRQIIGLLAARNGESRRLIYLNGDLAADSWTFVYILTPSSLALYMPEACDNIWGKVDLIHDDVIKWKFFSRYWPFVRGIHRSPVNSPHKGQWRGALTFSLICVWRNGWVNNREAGDLRRYRAHYDVIVMFLIDIELLTDTVVSHTENDIYWNISHADICTHPWLSSSNFAT